MSVEFPVGWMVVINDESEPCPAYGVVEAKSIDATTGLLVVGKPSRDNSTAVFFNGGSPIPPGERGQIHKTFPSRVAYQASLGADPLHDEEWGVLADSWCLQPGQKGFVIIGDGSMGVANVIEQTTVPLGRTLTIDGVAYDLSENRSWTTSGGGGGGAVMLPTAALATAAALPAGTYSNGASGVGATFTVTATGTLTVDGSVTVLGQYILVKNQASAFQNGLYVVTTAGAIGVQAVLTRHTLNDEALEFIGVIYNVGASGNVNKNTEWRCTNLSVPTIGTTDITIVPLNFITGSAAFSTTAGHIRAASEPSGSTAGNARGTGAVDFQQMRTAATSVASGNFASILGGYSNAASGHYSACAGGAGNVASGAEAFIGAGEANLASGSYSFIGCGVGNLASGAGAAVVNGSNNDATGDLAGILSGYDNVASGAYSGILAGSGGTASGTRSAVLSGAGNTASGHYSVGLAGQGAIAHAYGMVTHSPPPFAVRGDAQAISCVYSGETTTGALTELFLDGATATERLTIPVGKAMFLVVSVGGFGAAGTNGCHYLRKVAIKNVGGTTALIGTVTAIGTDYEDSATCDVVITADDANDSLKIAVEQTTGEDTRWVVHVAGVQIGHGA